MTLSGEMRVNSALKALGHSDRSIIAKWKDLHHDDRARFLRRVNPEKGVVNAGPRQRAGGTAAFDGSGVDGKSQAEFIKRTGDADGIFGELGCPASQFRERQVPNLVATHLPNGFGLKNPFAAEFSAAEQHLLEL